MTSCIILSPASWTSHPVRLHTENHSKTPLSYSIIIWQRVKELARNNVDAILLINSAVELYASVDVRCPISTEGMQPGPEGSLGEEMFRNSRG